MIKWGSALSPFVKNVFQVMDIPWDTLLERVLGWRLGIWPKNVDVRILSRLFKNFGSVQACMHEFLAISEN
jgi:hypothetical protein